MKIPKASIVIIIAALFTFATVCEAFFFGGGGNGIGGNFEPIVP